MKLYTANPLAVTKTFKIQYINNKPKWNHKTYLIQQHTKRETFFKQMEKMENNYLDGQF